MESKIAEKKQTYFKSLEESLDEAREQAYGNKEKIEGLTIGCKGECPFCGARCEETV
eukprot:CAMPEP_0170454566 /NCGR_PEP_ID=MMETSP0123-20130129/2775_1 /TAXON_ID=182087 /ORGANISM="Favella ehrenbergii, Strain Fehren 1" /LENGTH=56 /DNA_ID=CAMNT_0010717321 /DNA_START=623 /DNA_END=793 /DNA_ORIENTATION=+